MEALSFITPMVIMLLFLGVIAGIIFGAIPGMTATMALAIFLPLTYALDISEALTLLLGLYVGGISGGFVPAILLNIPGTPSSITTTFDGYPMARNGQGKKALRIAVTASLFGGLVSLVLLALFTPMLSELAMKFSYVEKFLIILFALSVIGSLSQGSLVGGLFSGGLGILISLIGAYSIGVGGNGKVRLVPSFLEDTLYSGFGTLPVLIGLFAVAIIFEEAEKGMKENKLGEIKIDDSEKFTLKDFKGQGVNLIRSSFIGTFVGMLPGVGGSAASILSYSQAKNFSKNKTEFGKGATSGLVASETANNALTGGALIPLLSLGIPGDSTTAVLIGAFTLQGIGVGPLFISNNPETWSNMLVIMLMANIAMFAVMFLAIKPISKVVFIPKYILFPIIAVMCTIGAYAVNYGVMFDVWSIFIFGLVGYIGKKLGLQIPPFLIGFILGKQAEQYFIKSLESFGTYTIFFTKSPMAVVLWILIIVSFAYAIVTARREKAEAMAREA
ncbi:MAG: tripartite tricarboxylate transporter permease [Lachnospirales bacterium]